MSTATCCARWAMPTVALAATASSIRPSVNGTPVTMTATSGSISSTLSFCWTPHLPRIATPLLREGGHASCGQEFLGGPRVVAVTRCTVGPGTRLAGNRLPVVRTPPRAAIADALRPARYQHPEQHDRDQRDDPGGGGVPQPAEGERVGPGAQQGGELVEDRVGPRAACRTPEAVRPRAPGSGLSRPRSRTPDGTNVSTADRNASSRPVMLGPSV